MPQTKRLSLWQNLKRSKKARFLHAAQRRRVCGVHAPVLLEESGASVVADRAGERQYRFAIGDDLIVTFDQKCMRPAALAIANTRPAYRRDPFGAAQIGRVQCADARQQALERVETDRDPVAMTSESARQRRIQRP